MTDEIKETEGTAVVKPTKAAKKEKKKQDEIDLFVPGTYVLSDGTKIERPKLSWGNQIKLLRQFSALLTAVPELKEVNFESFKIQDLVQILPSILDKAPEAFSDMCALILDTDKEWIDEHLQMDDVLGLIVPFLKGLFSRIGKSFQGTAAEEDNNQ